MWITGFLIGFQFDSIGIEAVLAGVERRGDLVPAFDFPYADRVDTLEGTDTALPSPVGRIDDEVRGGRIGPEPVHPTASGKLRKKRAVAPIRATA